MNLGLRDRRPWLTVFLAIAAVGAVGAAGDTPPPGAPERGKLLVQEDFVKKAEAPAPSPSEPNRHPGGWKYAVGRWEASDGVLTGVELSSDHHPAHAVYGLAYRDIVLECEVRLDDCRMTRIRAADADYVWSVRMTPDGFSVFKDDHDHDGPDKDVLLARVAMPVERGTWYPLQIKTQGDQITATFAGQSAGGTHPKLGVAKASLRFAVVGGSASYRKLRVWEALPKPVQP
jgi:hypothetical protein